MDSQRTLYQIAGGAEGIHRIVDELYRRVLHDPELSPFFARTPPDRLREMQHQFISAALGGPVAYGGRTLTDAHRGRGISRHHITLFTAHLIAAMRGLLASEDDARAIAARINLYADEVTGDADAENP
jgi:hemoglobin